MLEDAERAGARIARIYTCPHAPDDRCQCRKPAPGLIRQAIAESGIGPDETLVVGDDLRDLTAARTAGVRAALVLTGKGRSVTAPLPEVETPVYDDLRTLALHLLAEGHIQGDSSK
jgi:D-glycero-D-manno-heptose 1,7-bisphosphate phosphatase